MFAALRYDLDLINTRPGSSVEGVPELLAPKKRAQVSAAPGQLAEESMAPPYLLRKNNERLLCTKKNDERLNTKVQMLRCLKQGRTRGRINSQSINRSATSLSINICCHINMIKIVI